MATQSIAQLFDLTGKSAIVTGGAMGIGQAIAFRLAEAGAKVMIADIDQKAANQTLNHINTSGGKAKVIRADITREADAKSIIQATIEAFGRLDILVNNAGIYPASPVMQITEDMWDKVLNTNLKGVFLCCQAAAQEMIKAGNGGKIINIASTGSIQPTGVMAHYDASKGGTMMLTKALALELAPHNIQVNAVAPGTIRTPGQVREIELGVTNSLNVSGLEQNKPSTDISGEQMQEIVEGVYSQLAAGLPMKRVGEPDDIARVVLFLASNAANYMTGTLLLVDGGKLLL